jgi:hypothetical protein
MCAVQTICLAAPTGTRGLDRLAASLLIPAITTLSRTGSGFATFS